jgi:enoyl-CoA hydratase/carnithine racemase
VTAGTSVAERQPEPGVRTPGRCLAAALEVTLPRPEKLHALDATGWARLREAVDGAGADQDVRAVVVRGDERSFCAGNDITAMVEAADSGRARGYFIDGMLPAFAAIATSPVPIISVVEGLALGGGVELLLFSDLVIASQEATFGLPETRIGVWPTVFAGASGATHARRAGARLGLIGEHVDAQTALALGLVTHVCERDAVESMLADVVGAIAAGDRDATARTKAWLNRDLIRSGLRCCRESLEELCADTLPGPGFREAHRNFMNNRQAAQKENR